MKNFFYYFTFLCFVGHCTFAQENTPSEEKFDHNQFGYVIAHTWQKNGKEGKSGIYSIPSSTVYYNYRFNEKWSLGLHTDLVTEDIITKSVSGDETIERGHPVAPAIMLGFKPEEHFTFLFGVGADIAKEETLALSRFDLEYGLEIRNGWEFVGAAGLDYRFNSYLSFQFGLGIAKSF